MLTKCMAGELGQYNIRSNAIRPAAMDTNLVQEAIGGAHAAFIKAHSDMQERLVLKDKLETFHVADLVVFLSSPAASMITGQDIALDKGISFT